MDILSALSQGFNGLIQNPLCLLLILLGVFLGIVFGAIPGLTAALAVSIVLPFTYSMSSVQGLTVLISIYVGGIAGGLISATLLNIPGSPASIVTCFDGAPMAKKGRPNDALTIGTFASLIGGLFSAVALICIAPQIAKISVAFGSWEYFAMGIMGLSVVVGLCSKDILKGLISAVIGVLLSTVGIDSVSSAKRFTFGAYQLNAGFSQLATLMGLFAFAEILVQIRNLAIKKEYMQVGRIRFIPAKEDRKGQGKNYLLSSVVGTFIGILPGIGQSTASLLSYNACQVTSKNKDKFGTGCADGIIASEAANNACCGGALIPMLTLGIPGDMVTAILLGGLTIHGLEPGPLLFTNSADIVGVVFVVFFLANIVMYLEQIGLMKFFIKLISVPSHYLYSFLLLMCVIGTFALNNRLFDAYVLLGIGIVSYILSSNGFPPQPIVLGYILGGLIEKKFRTAIISGKGSMAGLFERPIALGMLAVSVLILVVSVISIARQNKKKSADKE